MAGGANAPWWLAARPATDGKEYGGGSELHCVGLDLSRGWFAERLILYLGGG